MKVVLTGGTGFVGRNLSVFLKNNFIDVINLSLRNSYNINYPADVIIHLAGKAHDTKNTFCDNEYYQVNTELTNKLFNEFLHSDIKDFIYFSSVKAVADAVEGVLDEKHSANPKTPYGMSKLKAEEYLLSQKLPEGKRLFILRPCMIHGAGNKGNLNLLYNVVRKGIPYPLGSFNNERSFLSIDNLNYIIKSILDNKNIPSGIYNVADDDFVSTNKLIALISKVHTRNPKIWNIPKSYVFFMVKIGDVLRLPLNSERLQKLTENYRVSNNKIKKALNIEKLPLTAQEGLLNTIQSFIIK